MWMTHEVPICSLTHVLRCFTLLVLCGAMCFCIAHQFLLQRLYEIISGLFKKNLRQMYVNF